MRKWKMKLKYKGYDRGNVRAYFKGDKGLYCVQLSYNDEPKLFFCSRDGEPSHPAIGWESALLTGFDGADWTMFDLMDYFDPLHGNLTPVQKMNLLFEDVNENQ